MAIDVRIPVASHTTVERPFPAANTVDQARAGAPPMVRAWPLLGSALELFRDPMPLFVRAYHEHGPIFRVRVPGRVYTVLAGPEATLFMAHGGEEHMSSYEIFATAMRELHTQHFIAALDGPPHRHQRAILKPALSRDAIARYIPRMARAAEQIARSWSPGGRVRVKPAMQALVTEQMCQAMTGRGPGSHFHDAVLFAETLVGAGIAGTWPRALLRRPAYTAAKARVVVLMRQMIAERRAKRARGWLADEPDLLDTLLDARNEDGSPLSDVELVIGAQLPYIAGMDTAAATCAFLLYALLKRPALLERVTAEVDAAFVGGTLRADALREMPALHAAAMETFRLYPVVSAAPRIARHPFEFEGRRVETGDSLLISTTTAHFLPQLFADPYRFDIERFEAPRNEHRQPGAFAPFAAGPHTCVASGLAEVTVLVTVAALLHSVRLRLDPEDYTLRTAVNPLPGPERRFALRVAERRSDTRPRLRSCAVR
ncbi:MAG: cytochrome P450 [Ktedonobacterales bacterium]